MMSGSPIPPSPKGCMLEALRAAWSMLLRDGAISATAVRHVERPSSLCFRGAMDGEASRHREGTMGMYRQGITSTMPILPRVSLRQVQACPWVVRK